jgi:hypothetical protein
MKTFIVIMIAVLSFPLIAESQNRIDYGNILHWAGSVDTPGEARGVAISGTHAYVADGDYGLRILPIQCEAPSGVEMETPAPVTFLFDAYPNPFNPQTTLAYDLPNRAAVSLRVYDLAGRSVWVLVDGEIVAEGRNETVWNGRDDSGRQVASGTYFYRLEAGEYSETRRMALVK